MIRSLAVVACMGGLVMGAVACSGDDEQPPSNGMAGAAAGTISGEGGTTGGTAGTTGGTAGTTGGTEAGTTGGTEAGTTGGTMVTGGMGGGEGGTGGDVGDANVWTMMGYDAKNHFHNPHETTINVDNAAMLSSKWTFTVAGVPHGGLAIAEGKVFATSTAAIYAIDLETGDELWSSTSVSGSGSVAYHDGAIYAHTATANLYKLDAENGDVLWGPVKTYERGGADGTSSPIVAGGKVLVGHSTSNEIFPAAGDQVASLGGVEAFDIASGTRAWTYTTVEGDENGAMVWSTVSVDEDAGMVFATTGNNYTVLGGNSDAFHAIDLMAGTRLWVEQVREGDVWVLARPTSQDTDFGANPILAEIGERKVVAAGDKGAAFWVVDRETGEQIWSRERLSATNSPAHGGVLNNGSYDGERFFVVSNNSGTGSTLHAFNKADGTDAWPPKTLTGVSWGMSSVANGVLFVPSSGILRIYNAATGEELHMLNTGGTIAAGAAAIAGGKVVVKSGMNYGFGGTSVIMNNEIHCYGL